MKLSLPLTKLALSLSVLSGLFLGACTDERDADVADMPLELEVVRVDSLMYTYGKAVRSDSSLGPKQAFAQYLAPEVDFLSQYLLLPPSAQYDPVLRDSLLAYYLYEALRDSALLALMDTVRDRFPYDYPFAEKIAPPLKRLVKYFPGVELPQFRTHVNGYPREVTWAQVDQLAAYPGYVSFGLHYFMGEDFDLYPPGIFGYQRRRLDPEYLEVTLVQYISESIVAPVPEAAATPFLYPCIRAGIKQYLMHRLLPYTPDSLLLRYTADQMEWARYYESKNYKLLMPQFYETDFKLERDYLSDKAYTSELSLESAPRLGEFVGWKIVESYMESHPDLSLEALCERQDYENILQEAKYKP